MQEPPIPSPYTECKKHPKLTCPFCGHQFPLTWGRYLKQGFKSHVKCPQCSEISHLQWSPTYKAWIFTLCIIAATIDTLAVIACFVFMGSRGVSLFPIAIAVVSLILICISYPIDKYFDSHYRPLVNQKCKR